MATTQRHEIEAWLGDDHGLTDQQIDDLMRTADEIADRHPDPDDHAERHAALTVAYRLMTGDTGVVDELGRELTAARAAESLALTGLKQAADMLLPGGGRPLPSSSETEAGFARRAGVTRMAVRDWLGKR